MYVVRAKYFVTVSTIFDSQLRDTDLTIESSFGPTIPRVAVQLYGF